MLGSSKIIRMSEANEGDEFYVLSPKEFEILTGKKVTNEND